LGRAQVDTNSHTTKNHEGDEHFDLGIWHPADKQNREDHHVLERRFEEEDWTYESEASDPGEAVKAVQAFRDDMVTLVDAARRRSIQPSVADCAISTNSTRLTRQESRGRVKSCTLQSNTQTDTDGSANSLRLVGRHTELT